MEDMNENEEMFNRQRRQIRCVDVAYFASHTHVRRNVWTQRRTRRARRPGPAYHACTLASLNGPYGFTGTGTIIGEGPVASVGTFTFDGEGIIVGHFSQSRNGNLNHQSPTGTYTVNSNCTGSWTLSNGSEVDFVIVAGGDELMWVRTDPGVVITAVGKKQFEHHE